MTDSAVDRSAGIRPYQQAAVPDNRRLHRSCFALTALVDLEWPFRPWSTPGSPGPPNGSAFIGSFFWSRPFSSACYSASCRAARRRWAPWRRRSSPTFQWGSMIMCTLLAGGGVFWAAGEPMAHFISSPPLFGRRRQAFSRGCRRRPWRKSYLHWGFLAWAILGRAHDRHAHALSLRKGPAACTTHASLPGIRRQGNQRSDRPVCRCKPASSPWLPALSVRSAFLGLQVSYGLEALVRRARWLRHPSCW